MSDVTPPNTFAPILGHFIASELGRFVDRISELSSGLDEDELGLVRATAEEALRNNAGLKLNRVLLLELHAAKRAGALVAGDETGRFAQFVQQCLEPTFLDHLDRRYPPLRGRLQRALEAHRVAMEKLVSRFVADRDALTPLLGQPAGRLKALALGQGDLHEGGQSVARLTLDGGTVMYKPRSLRVDAALETFLHGVFGDRANRVRVPSVLDCGNYGWAAFVVHRYCEGDADLRIFYRGLGHWLAVLRLLGGTDIHLENLIAAGPVPIVIDVESLFAPPPTTIPSGYGDAHDNARILISGSVLRTGIVPLRTPALGFDGVDLSAAGALPGQQPQVQLPVIVDEGTTEAQLRVVKVDVSQAQNHPSPDPQVSRYWDQISEGFVETTARLRQLDVECKLVSLLEPFEGCRVRDIRRPTQAYVEIGRMLWHPASLHDEPAAVERARDLLARNAAVVPMAPSAPEEISAEIDDLRYGDVPVFAGPLHWSRIHAVLEDWRAMRTDVEELTIRSALVATDLNQRLRYREEERQGKLYAARNPRKDNLEPRRRKLAADAVGQLLKLAVRGDDGTVTWITPEIDRAGWMVQPVRPDLYFGFGGIAVALAGYLHESRCERVPQVAGIEETLRGAMKVMTIMEASEKPDTVGGFSGLGSQIWTWLILYDLLQEPALLTHAVGCAKALEQEGFENDRKFDIIDGAAGAMVPLLGLAEATSDERWLALACRAARRLEDAAILSERGAGWPMAEVQDPVGGFAHGATGIAWALMRLILAGAGTPAERGRWRALAKSAFRFQEALYDERLGNWLDIRPDEGGGSYPTWCHGSIGIGLAACDLYARTGEATHLDTVRRAVAHARDKWGSSHTLCHGDLSLWELLVSAAELDPQACHCDRDEATAQIVSAIEEHHGMVGGLTRAAFTPGLMTGLAGAVHGLCRMHPQCELASPLLLERRAPRPDAGVGASQSMPSSPARNPIAA